jgi:hypothetical protein
MSKKHIEAIANYERCRQRVRELDEHRKAIIAKCRRLSEGDGLVYSKDGFTELAKTCLEECWRCREDDGQYQGMGGFLDFITCFFDEGECCEHCIDSYKIKIGPLAEAKKQFGIAKRTISALGKSALK